MSARTLHRALPVFLAGAALAGLPHAASATQTYTNPTARTFIVPPGVTKLFVTERRAQGGNGGYNGSTGGTGGRGGTITGTLAVTPGEDLRIAVGGRGGDASGGTFGAGGLAGTGAIA